MLVTDFDDVTVHHATGRFSPGRGAMWPTIEAMNLEPIEEMYQLTCSCDVGFDTWVAQIGRWWHPQYTANAETFSGVHIEPHVGGRVFESHRDGTQIEWGRVKVFEPGRRIVYSSSLAQEPQRASEISVTFSPTATGSQLHFAHGGWNDRNADDRQKFRQWRTILDRYAAMVGETAVG